MVAPAPAVQASDLDVLRLQADTSRLARSPAVSPKQSLAIGGVLAAAIAASLFLWDGRWTPSEKAPDDLAAALANNRSAPPVSISTEDPELPARQSARELVDSPNAKKDSANPPTEVTARLVFDGTVVVIVTDQSTQQAVPDARVGLWKPKSGSFKHSSGWMIEDTECADDQGVVRLPVPTGVPLRLHVQRPSCEDGGATDIDVSSLARGESREVPVELPAARHLDFWGRVVAEDGGQPLGGARVRISSGGRMMINGRWVDLLPISETETDGNGLFELRVPSWKHLDGNVDAAGYGPIVFEIEGGHETSATAQELRLPRAASLAAHVLNVDGDPGVVLKVNLETDEYRLSRPRSSSCSPGWVHQWWAITGSEGDCVVKGLAPGVPLRMEIFQGGGSIRKERAPIVLAPGEERSYEVRLSAGARLHGLAVDLQGQPVIGEEIWLGSPERVGRLETDPAYFKPSDADEVVAKTFTDEEGRFEFLDVSAGAWGLGVAATQANKDAPEESLSSRVLRLNVAGGISDHEVVLRVTRGLFIRGRVFEPREDPIADASIYAHCERGRSSLEAMSAKDGSFAIGPLDPGNYVLQATAFGTYSDSEFTLAQAGSDNVNLRLESTGEVGGTILDAVTGECPRAEVTLVGPVGGFPRRIAESQGAFRFRGLRRGVYAIQATTSDGRIVHHGGIRVEAGEEISDIVLRLNPGGKLRLRHEGKSPLVRYNVWAEGNCVASGEMLSGYNEMRIVPAGKLTVLFISSTGLAEYDVMVGAGQLVEVVCRLE
jgi:carboxypeptidase family protein